MAEKRQIFVSAVQKELAAERRAIKDFVEGDALLSRFFDLFLFEDIPASDRRADEVYLSEVDQCSVYVAILGNEYGSEDAEGISPTEREFDRATATGRTRLIFVKGTDDRARHPKMQALTRKAGAQLIRRRFKAVPELTAGLYASLVEYLEDSGAIQTGPFDASPCPKASLDDLSEEKVAGFLQKAQRARDYALSPDTPMTAALAHLNLLAGQQPSHAAILLFGKRPQRFLPTSELKCLHFHGTEVRKPIPSYQVYKGTVFELVDQAIDFVMSKIASRVGTRAEGPQAPVDYELPREAVAEAIVNSVAHRDYASNASVQVVLLSDRLEVWNPGELPRPLTPDLLRVPHASIPRNPLIAEPLFLTRYIDKAGTGTLDMIAQCDEAGLRPPEFLQQAGQFVQRLWRPSPTGEIEVEPGAKPKITTEVTGEVTREVAGDVTTEVARLLPLCVAPRSRKELQGQLGLRNDEHFRIAYLAPAISAGLLEMTIPSKPKSRLQKYRLTAKGKAWLAAQHKDLAENGNP